MSYVRRPELPSGMSPPEIAESGNGNQIQLRPLAELVTARHLERHPEDVERYGREMAQAWGVHDTQHLLAWAIADADLSGQLAWLARVLDARGYPVANLIDNVRTAATVAAERLPQAAASQIAERLRAAADELAAAWPQAHHDPTPDARAPGAP